MSYRIAVLGAGISGLAMGWHLKKILKTPFELTVIEKSKRGGGWIQTVQKEGFLFELGPRSCRAKGAGKETLKLIESLGLQDQLLLPHPDAHNRFVHDGTGLQKMPRHLWQIPFNPLFSGVLKALWRDWQAPKRDEADESIHSFFSRRLGSSWVENFIDPLVSGIYAGNCKDLSIKSCFPLFDQWEHEHGSLLRGALRTPSDKSMQSSFIQRVSKGSLFSFQEGMETLPRALANHLKDHLLLGETVERLDLHPQGVEIHLKEGICIRADLVISTLPTYSLAPLLAIANPILAEKISILPYASLAAVNMGFDQNVLPLKGFGYLVPSKFKKQVLGCVWDSSIFPQQNQPGQTRLTFMMGGVHHPEVAQMTESEIIHLAFLALREDLKILKEPKVIHVQKALKAIPQFQVGHSNWKSDIQKEISRLSPRLHLSGSAWSGVSINDCIADANRISQLVAKTEGK